MIYDINIERSIARSAAAMIRILGASTQADANSVAAQFAKLNDAEAEKTWRAIAQAIEKQRLLTRPAITRQLLIEWGASSGTSALSRELK